MNLNELISQRRSVRKYKSQPIEQAILDELTQVLPLAPSWKNSQCARYYFIKTPEIVERIRKTLPEFNQMNCADAPVLIVTSFVLNRSGYERNGEPSNELGNMWGAYDCGLSNMNLLLKAQELGLSTLVMGLRDEVKIKEILNLDESQAIVSVIALGYSDQNTSMPKRKMIEDIVQEI